MSEKEAQELLRVLKIRRVGTKSLYDEYQREMVELDKFIQQALTITDYKKQFVFDWEIPPVPLDAADLAIRLLEDYLKYPKREV